MMYFYGCIGEAGHYLFDEKLRHADWISPWGHYPDGNLTPHEPSCRGDYNPARGSFDCNCAQRPDRWALHQKDGWTALSCWDRSVDGRRGSNANFFAEGEHGFAEMTELARRTFPTLWPRFENVVKHQGEPK